MRLGLTGRAVQRRIDAGRWHPLHRGIYAVGHAKLTLRGYWMAAVLACGRDAVVSHRFALAVWEVQAAGSGLIDVTVPGHGGRRGPSGVRVHGAKTLQRRDLAVVDGIPVTSLARTVLDFSSSAAVQRTRLVLERIERMGRLIGRELEDVIERTRAIAEPSGSRAR
jgi:predicted transcriptional regulator of viral defense system